MEQIISKEEFDKLISLKGKVRGVAFKTEEKFILKEKGEEGLKKLEETIKEAGYPMKFREIKSMEFYPLGLITITQLAIKRLFDYDDEKMRELGSFEAKSSLIIRLFMKYFVSLDKMVKEAPKIWGKYYTTGNLKVVELNKKEKYVILRLENFQATPTHCQNLVGYFSSVVQMIVKDSVVCKETKCIHLGDDHHEFLAKW